MIVRIVKAALVAGALALVIHSLPDAKRYVEMRQM